MVDLAIVAFIVLGAVAGFGKGFVIPLAAAGGAVLTLATLYAGPLTGALPSGTAGLGVGAIALFVGGTVFSTVATFVVGIVHRVGIFRRFDKVLGVPLGKDGVRTAGHRRAAKRGRRESGLRRVRRSADAEGSRAERRKGA